MKLHAGMQLPVELCRREGCPVAEQRVRTTLQQQVSYRSYWTHVVLEVLHENHRGNLSIKDISDVRVLTLMSGSVHQVHA